MHKRIIITIKFCFIILIGFSQQKLNYKDGDEAFVRFIKSSFNADSTYGQSRYINIYFQVDKKGRIDNITTMNPLNDPIYSEMKRVLLLTKGKWKIKKNNPKPILLIVGFLNSLEEKKIKSNLANSIPIMNRNTYLNNNRTYQIADYVVVGPIIFEWMY